MIGGVVLEQPAGGGIGAASVGPRVCGRVISRSCLSLKPGREAPAHRGAARLQDGWGHLSRRRAGTDLHFIPVIWFRLQAGLLDFLGL